MNAPRVSNIVAGEDYYKFEMTDNYYIYVGKPSLIDIYKKSDRAFISFSDSESNPVGFNQVLIDVNTTLGGVSAGTLDDLITALTS